MSEKIKIGIVGYGNLGKGAEAAIVQNPDMELVAVFTRRNVEDVAVATKAVKVLRIEQAETMKDQIDVLLLCGGSATDLPVQAPYFARMFNTVDSYDTHAMIPDYYNTVDLAAKDGKKTCIISIGWDPGLFSLNRMLAEAVLPYGKEYTFWGRGVSQGHSDAIRRVSGVRRAVQYTIPSEEAINNIRSGDTPELGAGERHTRDCYVVVDDGADKERIAHEIKTMPHYFADYKTRVHFISDEELQKEHTDMPHGGFVLRSGETGLNGSKHLIEFSLKLASNPEFTASVLVAYARAAYRLSREGQHGAKTIFDIPLSCISQRSPESVRRDLL